MLAMFSAKIADGHYGSACWMYGEHRRRTQHNTEALVLARQLSHPFSLAWAKNWAARRSHHLRDNYSVQDQTETLLALSAENGFAQFVAHGTILKGWALAYQGGEEEGIALMRQGLEAMRTTGAELSRPWFLALLAETYGRGKRFQEGFAVLTEALALVQQSGEHASAAELHRLRGEFLLGLQHAERT